MFESEAEKENTYPAIGKRGWRMMLSQV